MKTHNNDSCSCSFVDLQKKGITPVKASNRALKLMKQYSQNFDNEKYNKIARFDLKELSLGKKLGEGAYNVVHEIRSIKLLNYGGNSRESDDCENKSCMACKCLRGNNNSRYAIKYLKPETMKKNFYRYQQGVVDIVREAAILSSLSHPNIVKLRGLSRNGTAGFAKPTEANYFLILDRLYGTLDEKIKKWATKLNSNNNKLKRMFTSSSSSLEKERSFLVKRLLIAYDIAQALQYLYERNIIFRDLKPQNIGFDVRGDVKIFDFGLSLELFESQRIKNGLYRIPGGNVGTVVYMAPEVSRNEPYNLSADVYSFGILLWQICTLKDPSETLNSNSRTDLSKKFNDISYQLQLLISSCCSDNIFGRPTISIVIQMLKEEISCLQSDQSDQTIATHLEERYYRRRSSTAIEA